MLQEPVPAGSSAPAVVTRRDLQRESLDNLIRLVKECAATEAQIDKDFAAAHDLAAKSRDKSVEAVTRKYQLLDQAARDLHDRKITEAEKQFEWSRDDLASKSKTRRARLAHDYDKSSDELKTGIEQATWLADSVLEAAEIRVKEEFKKAKERITNAEAALAALEDQAKTILVKYGQSSPPRADDAPPLQLSADLPEQFESQRQIADKQMKALDDLKFPRLIAGGKDLIVGVIFIIIPAILSPMIIKQSFDLQLVPMIIAAVASIGIVGAVHVFLTVTAKKQIAESFIPLRNALETGGEIIKAMSEQADSNRLNDDQSAVETRKKEVAAAKDKFTPLLDQAAKTRDAQVLAVRNEAAKRLAELERQRDAARTDADAWQKSVLPKLKSRSQRHLQVVSDRHDAAAFDAHCEHDKSRSELEQKWSDGLVGIRSPIGDSSTAIVDWTGTNWDKWIPPKKFAETVRFGQLQVDLTKIVESASVNGQFTLPLPGAFSLPALLALPKQCSLLIHTDPAGRADALAMLQLVMVRLLTTQPAGRVHFTIIDPAGLGQNFAGFMHLAEYDEAMVGTKIWTSHEHIDQRLTDLTEHMETVIQKYLRNEFETIDEYNAQAGELAEPYRFLVIADFPAEFEADSLRRLSSIASTGARCGVYTLIARDIRLPMPSGSHFEDVESHSVNLIRKDGKFAWKDEVFKQFPLTLDSPPPDETLTKIMNAVGKGAKEASRVEVPFDTIVPKAAQLWTLNSASDLAVPVGRMGATRFQYVRLGRGVAQHALVAGKTGSGKSSLLNALITNIALWYPPDQVMLYLIDFKKGVEFKTYATHNLPHARAIAVESDREFGASVLQRIDAELTLRGELYRKLGVQDLAAYRQTPNAKPMPRILLVIDEFQEFFSEDDKLSQEAGLLLDRLVRQGRAFGIHVFLGSQTLAGSAGLSRSTLGQMGVRVALQCSEADSQLILGDNNSAARLLSRPGEAIYNDAGGLVEGNSPFQVAWLPDDKREEMLKVVFETATKRLGTWESPIVFEGNSPAPIDKNTQLVRLLDDPNWALRPSAPAGWLGDPVAIKAPTAVLFRRQSGANLIMIGQQEESAMAMMAAVLASLSAQFPPAGVKFIIFDGSPADSPLASILPGIKDVLPHDVQLVDYRGVADALNELAQEMAKRQAVEPTAAGSGDAEIVLFIYGVQRYRTLRKQEESYSFSATDEEKKPDPGKQFADILREGPALGIHVVAWADTPASIDRTLDRTSMREFDYRVLFQMSANDSSNLIDSPAANKLGPNRALVYSEEQGTMEKFRPYALPDKEWLRHIKTSLAAKKAITD